MSISFTDNSARFISDKNAAVVRALEAIGLQAEGYVKLLTPVDTGRLRNSISHAQYDEKTEAVGTNVEYAPYVELGTRRMSAQPYLRPGVENHAEEYKAIAEYYLKGG